MEGRNMYVCMFCEGVYDSQDIYEHEVYCALDSHYQDVLDFDEDYEEILKYTYEDYE